MLKKIGIIVLIIMSLTFVSYMYLRDGKQGDDESVYLKTVVFKDKDDVLVPVSVNFHSQVDLEQEVRNRIDLMKSNELQNQGLYPVLSSDLQVLSVNFNHRVLTLNVNDEIVANSDDMDILESLTYTLTDYDEVDRLKLQIDGKDISYLPNSFIPVSLLTRNLGLNNFIETSALLHETIPAMVYNEKVITNHSFYIPTTLRLKENDSIENQVTTILNQIQGDIQVIDVSLEQGILNVELGSNILLDNEKIDQTLEDLIVLSLSSLKNVKDVRMTINKENVKTRESSVFEYNYVKI